MPFQYSFINNSEVWTQTSVAVWDNAVKYINYFSYSTTYGPFFLAFQNLVVKNIIKN